MDDPQSSTAQQVQVPTLQTLPDPHALWSAPHSSKYLLQEARANIASFDGLRAHIQSGRISTFYIYETVDWAEADGRLRLGTTYIVGID